CACDPAIADPAIIAATARRRRIEAEIVMMAIPLLLRPMDFELENSSRSTAVAAPMVFYGARACPHRVLESMSGPLCIFRRCRPVLLLCDRPARYFFP